jgi:hypothetical protein
MAKVNCRFISCCNYWLRQGYHNVVISRLLAKTVEAPHHIRTRIGVGMNTSEM